MRKATSHGAGTGNSRSPRLEEIQNDDEGNEDSRDLRPEPVSGSHSALNPKKRASKRKQRL